MLERPDQTIRSMRSCCVHKACAGSAVQSSAASTLPCVSAVDSTARRRCAISLRDSWMSLSRGRQQTSPQCPILPHQSLCRGLLDARQGTPALFWQQLSKRWSAYLLISPKVGEQLIRAFPICAHGQHCSLLCRRLSCRAALQDKVAHHSARRAAVYPCRSGLDPHRERGIHQQGTIRGV